ncbi:MAG: KH domain-containing protein [Candidatus Nezhaarchaeota archaeon]|nr:KH domain-containing protein [Candidatus Nezhaarchaeota archaeon]MCX8141696.1 KH domain-containing protein [Candidatus Nezhaarchaeota archaeon]MDW8049963.1 KH domain-containing protein [Nitrososphaerota archaeon]
MSSAIYREYIQIPLDRVGPLIGRNGSIKREIEETYGVKLEIEGSTGRICIELLNPSDPSKLLTVKSIIEAIGHGINPEKALEIFSEEDAALHIINLKQIVGDSRDNLRRIKGRIIGEKGKARRLIEELTNTSISVSEHTIAIVGKLENVEVARRAIEMLISGSPHNVVWRYLYGMRRKLKRRGFLLWEPEVAFKTQDVEGMEEGDEKGG